MRILVLVTALSILFTCGPTANASLTTIGTAQYLGNEYKLIFEGQLGGNGLVWLDYTNARDSWSTQVGWTSYLGGSLTVTLQPGYATTTNWSTGWRLPSTDESMATVLTSGLIPGFAGPDESGHYSYSHGYNMMNSEMGNLYYGSLGNKGAQAPDGTTPVPGSGLVHTGDFEHLLPYAYRSGTELSIDAGNAWIFSFTDGNQTTRAKSSIYYALAVHPANISATPVPLPGAVWLFGSGLVMVWGRIAWDRRPKKHQV